MAREPKYTDEQVRSAVEGAHSLAEAIRNLGLRPAGANHRSIRKLIARYGISTVHFDPNWASRRGNHARREIPLDRVLVEHSTYGRGHLKRRLYETGLKQRRCEMCGQNELWNGQMMSLILDHINGVADDNRLENLRIVCPNCAATLETHCGRKNRLDVPPRSCLHCGRSFVPKYGTQRYCSHPCGVHSKGPRDPQPSRRKVDRPTLDQLRQDLAAMSVCAVGRKYGVSDNAVRKWVRWYEEAAARKTADARGLGGGEEGEMRDPE